MKKYKAITFGLALTCFFTSLFAYKPLAPKAKHREELKLVTAFLSNHHYLAKSLDDEMSSEVLKLYVDKIDYGKYIFTKDDINSFHKYNLLLDNYSGSGNLTPAYEIYNLYAQKMLKRLTWIDNYLSKPLRKDRKDFINFDNDKILYSESEKDLDLRWEKRLTYEWLNLLLAKKDELKARETIKKRYENIGKRIERSKSSDVFEVFMNAMTGVYDPHTTYFSPKSAESFNMNMSLSLEGIGASLSMEDEMVTISALIVGGPAKKSGELHVNDQIIGVAQGKNGEFVDVVGWRLDEVVDLIRGKRGSLVRLMIQQAFSGNPKEVSIVREKIKLEEQAAKSEVKVINGKKVGIIDLPSFYHDFQGAKNKEEDYRSTTRDVARIINQLKIEKIEGLIIDLRNNGGGSLPEAIDMTGLFIDEGPVVQVKDTNENKEVYSDKSKGTLYDGPLGVLINGNSASASEIFAGAIKDYGRGLLMGEGSYGKGTVQGVFRLSKFLPSITEKTGDLKLTRSMFYRINGSSTQLRGVLPDIYIPVKSFVNNEGESEELHALPWQKISPADFTPNDRVSKFLFELSETYEQYRSKTPSINLLIEQKVFIEKLKNEKSRSLNFDERKKKSESKKKFTLDIRNKLRKNYGYSQLTEKQVSKKDNEKTEKEKDKEKSEKIDVELDAAVFMMSSLIEHDSQ